jgi:hypothetical protein
LRRVSPSRCLDVNYVLRSIRREARREIVEALEESSWRWSTKK